MYRKCNLLKKLSVYALAVMLIVDCRAMIGYMDVTPAWWFTFKNVLMIILLLIAIYICNNGKIKIPTKQLKSSILLVSYLLCYLMMSGYAAFFNFQRIIVILFLLIYSVSERKKNGIEELLCKYKNLVFLISVASFALWFMGCILKLKIPYHTIYTTWSGTKKLREVKSYYGICNMIGTIEILGQNIPKNASIFTEAPMASFNFCIALMTEFFFEKRSSKVKVLLLVLAIISTFSSTGLIFLMLLMISKYFVEKQRNGLKTFVKYLILPIMAILGTLATIEMFNAKMMVNSGVIRLDDFAVCFQAWQSKKILGAGIGNDNYLVQFMGVWRTFNQGLSNSPGQILAHGGIWIAVVYIWVILYSLYKMLKAKDKYNFIYFSLFLYLFTITVCSYQYVTYTILIWAIQLHRTRPKVDKNYSNIEK